MDKRREFQNVMITQKKLWEEEIYTTNVFFKGMKEYLSLSISDALVSEQWMIRLFALLDKRLGKRRLIRLKEEIKNYPNKLIEVYKIWMIEEVLENFILDL